MMYILRLFSHPTFPLVQGGIHPIFVYLSLTVITFQLYSSDSTSQNNPYPLLLVITSRDAADFLFTFDGSIGLVHHEGKLLAL